MNDLVSIIVPIYNKEVLLERCVDSLICQTYPNIEILLIDDGSSDNSWSICQYYQQKDCRVKPFSKRNGGLSDARNFGLTKATGKWVSFVDADDYVELDFIEKLLGNTDKYDLSVCCAFFISDKGRRIVNHAQGNCILLDKETIYNKLLYPLITLDQSKMSLLPCVWNKLYRKGIIDENRLSFDIIPLVEDFLFNIHYFNVISNARFIDTPLVNYDCTPPSSLSKNKNFIERINVSYYAHSKIMELFPVIGKEVFPSVFLWNIKNNIFSYARRIGISGFKSFLDEVYNLDAFIEIANSGKKNDDWFVLMRRKGCYNGFICSAYIYSGEGFVKYYIMKLINKVNRFCH